MILLITINAEKSQYDWYRTVALQINDMPRGFTRNNWQRIQFQFVIESSYNKFKWTVYNYIRRLNVI